MGILSVVAIVVIAVVVLALLLAVFVFMPRLREQARVRKQQHELGQRRKQVVSEEREHADGRVREAEVAEQRARVAQQEAERERAEAQLHQERATLHERGLADHELVADHERGEFAGTSAAPESEGREAPE